MTEKEMLVQLGLLQVKMNRLNERKGFIEETIEKHNHGKEVQKKIAVISNAFPQYKPIWLRVLHRSFELFDILLRAWIRFLDKWF